MKRYQFLEQDDVFEALNKVRDAFLAAKDGNDVEQVMNGLLTFDERMKIGRRILIAKLIMKNFTIEEIQFQLKVGKSTISSVSKNLEDYRLCFQLIAERENKIINESTKKSYRKTGGSLKVFKKKEYTGFTKKKVKR